MSPGNTDRVMAARAEDVRTELKRLADAGIRPTARTHSALYGQARRVPGLNWRHELAMARRKPDPGPKPQADIHSFVREVDAVSPYPLPGLPKFMRERQVLGGRTLELFAKMAGEVGDIGILHPDNWQYASQVLRAALDGALKGD